MKPTCFSCKEAADLLLSWPGVKACPYCEGCAENIHEQLEAEGKTVSVERL